MNSADVRHFILQIALKCADISNPARPWEVSRKWSMKVCEEFFRQGDYERQVITVICIYFFHIEMKIRHVHACTKTLHNLHFILFHFISIFSLIYRSHRYVTDILRPSQEFRLVSIYKKYI